MKNFFLLAFFFSSLSFSQKNIISVFEPLEIKEPFSGDITVYFTHISIESKIDGKVFVIGGTCHLKENSSVKDLTIIFGNLKIEKGAKIEGNKILIAPIEERGTNIQNKISLSLFWLFFAFFLTLLFPSQIATSIFIFKKKIKESFFVGFLSLILFFLLFSLFFLFTSLYIGWPLLLALIGFFFLSKAYGTVVLFWTIGSKIAKKWGKIGSLFFGWLFLSLIRLIPYFGSIFWISLTFFAIGIVIVHISFRYKAIEIIKNA